jgi:hypothetical protein
MGIGNPITLTGNVSSKTISVTATGGQTLFSVTGGYRINQVSVYRNGTRLVDALDYTARDGSTVTLLSPATGGDILEFQVFDDFRVADALNVNSGGVVNGSVSIVSAATTALLVDGNARVTGILTVGTSSITLDGANNQILVGTGVTISSSGVIGSSELPAGSVGSPSLFFTGDANTGIYSPGADQVAVATNGTQRISIAADGDINIDNGGVFYDASTNRLAIGTTSPGTRLWVSESATGATNGTNDIAVFDRNAEGYIKVLSPNNTTGGIAFGDPDDNFIGAVRYDHSSDNLNFFVNNSERARIDSSGRLLVGTSSAAATYVSLGLQGNGSVATNQATLAMARGSNPSGDTQELGRIEFFNNNSNSGGAIIALSDGAWTSGSSHPTRLEFSTTADGASSPTERMRITSAGLMGLGTSSVSRLLHVAQANSTAYSSSDFEQDYQILRLNNTTNDGSVGLEFQVGTNGQASITANEVTDGQTDICFGTRGSGARTEKVRITSAGLVGIGVTSPQSPLDVTGSGNIGALSDLALRVYSANRSAFLDVGFDGLNASTNSSGLKFFLNNTERARIDSSGRLLIGTSSTNGSFNSAIQIAGSGVAGTQLISRFDNNAGAPNFYFAKSRGASVNTNTLVQSGDEVGVIGFYAADGTNYVPAAQIRADIDGTPGTNDMPGRLVFATTADGASGPTERMRITSGGLLKVTTGTQHSRYTNAIDHAIIQDKDNWLLACVNTYNSGPNGILITYSAQDPNNTSSSFLYCEGTTTLRAQIRSNGGLVNYQANDVNLSDRNVKKDISLAADTWNCIKEWEIVNYRYKDQPDDADLNLGVIAQQVAESCPEVITVFEEAKDDREAWRQRAADGWQSRHCRSQTRIETLETEVAALKAS